MTNQLIGHQKFPIILVDWSPINGQEIFQVLRASIPIKGRSLTLDEKIYPKSELNTNKAYQEFLDTLESIYLKGVSQLLYLMLFIAHHGLKLLKKKTALG